ncbi:cupin domain-containing protein [Pedobacter miscanthi]|uniref:Cupin domain-containing protein n=2 Tax=Pedobacter miscanthi TaxID=2259170 RepID=A0A366KSM5_9SPHI|nr:cupin domain-containing protein [Pedobacter miscanthi]
MKYYVNYTLVALVFLFTACGNNQKIESVQSPPVKQLIFPKGDKNTSDNFEGEVWVKSLIDADSLNDNAVGNVTFSPGARSKWHSHPAGQILLVTDGVGYYQEKGQPKKILRKGDVIKCPPNVPHWHGASQDTMFVQVAITSRQKGPTVWLEAVTDRVYLSKSK